ncbi:class I SAM-dependent methyltransferase [Lampropedia puyangensis]|uniref:Class I SAM-dependent methyltransferase n=1 Tax=Lampropedia puyangensis TaxID=1330072 RepID=A0A4S8F3G6_9BURK|nr:class I SAM-dependent methyltransferase [Lampropedia puyangensis]THU00985.1 class I SAM-dependent methyltransferase [Lampropedia puyangensis]
MGLTIENENNAFNQWLLHAAAGQYVCHWQQQHYDHAVADYFGYYALQIGASAIHALHNSRIQHCWQLQDYAGTTASAHLCAHAEALPFETEQFDLLVMPHGLELCHQPHAALREACRVLRPEGRLIISGFNPVRLLGRTRPALSQQQLGTPIGYLRLRDWLHLLNLEVQDASFGCFLPSFKNTHWYSSMAWVDRIATPFLPFLGNMYWLVATKKVHGAYILAPNWKRWRVQPHRCTAIASPNKQH